MPSNLQNRIGKLEKKNSAGENPITEIIVQYINTDGSVDSTMVKKLVDGIWHKQKEDPKSTNKEFI